MREHVLLHIVQSNLIEYCEINYYFNEIIQIKITLIILIKYKIAKSDFSTYAT